MKNLKYILLLLIVGVLLNGVLTQMIQEDYCDVEDAAALTQWYTHVFRYIKTNQNNSHQIYELNEKLTNLEAKVEETHKILQTIQEQMEQLQQKTNGDIVIQRRMDGSVNFFRSWADYKQGFGNSSGEFFIGLEKLHKLTNSRPYELLIVMEDWENDRRYARYDQFIVGSEPEKYPLTSLGTYSGSAGDSMVYELGQKFSTIDRDNDLSGSHCAVSYTGAWWYKECHLRWAEFPNGLMEALNARVG